MQLVLAVESTRQVYFDTVTVTVIEANENRFRQQTSSQPTTLSLVLCQTATHGRTTATAEVGDDVLERAAELNVEHGVEDRVDGRVGVAEPEQERIQPVWKIAEPEQERI